MTTSLLVGSFWTNLQILTFDSSTNHLHYHIIPEPAFQTFTWISPHPTIKGLFYAVQTPQATSAGNLSVIRVQPDLKSGYSLELLQTVSSGGLDPCHVGIHPQGKEVAIANYDSSNVTIYQLDERGLVRQDTRENVALHDLPGQCGVNAERQEAPHPHGCFYTSENQLLVPDLGKDSVYYIGTNPCRRLKSVPGAGPRHLVLHTKGSYAYVLNELNNTVAIHSVENWDEDNLPRKTYSTLPADCLRPAGEGMFASAIMLSEDAQHLYVTNRMENHPQGDSITWYGVSKDGSDLEKLGDIRTGLDHLRGAALFSAQDRSFLVTGSKTGKGAVVLERHKQTGGLTEVARQDEVCFPSCFVPL